jgi:malate dehydrogenase
MREVAIIGAGELGGALAHMLARAEVARTITLVDERAGTASGKALDISQAAGLERFATRVGGSTDISAALSAELVVIADRMRGGEWHGDEGWQLLAPLSRTARHAVIVCAGAGQIDLVDRGVRELGFSRRRLFGSAPEALSQAARAIIALAVNASPRDVSASAIGVPPEHIVIPWEDAAVDGFALTRIISEPTRRLLSARIEALWPPGPYALASAAAKVVATMARGARQLSICFVGPDTSAGLRTRTAALPVRLGRDGIAEVVFPSLSVGERVAFDNATQI